MNLKFTGTNRSNLCEAQSLILIKCRNTRIELNSFEVIITDIKHSSDVYSLVHLNLMN